MIRAIRSWIRARHLARERDGYNFAAGEILRSTDPDATIEHLSDLIENSRRFDDGNDAFNFGMIAAINRWSSKYAPDD